MTIRDYIDLKKQILSDVDALLKYNNSNLIPKVVVNVGKVHHDPYLPTSGGFNYIVGCTGYVKLDSYTYQIFLLLPEEHRLKFLVKLMIEECYKGRLSTDQCYKVIKQSIEEITTLA